MTMVTKITEAQKAALLAAGGTQDDVDAAERGDVEFDWGVLAAAAAIGAACSHDHGIAELADLINFQVAAWHDFGYDVPPTPECKAIPPLGERSAAAIKASHEAVEAIDQLTRQLYRLREQLVGELRQDSDIRGARVDEMLARRRACGARPYPVGSEGDDGTECMLDAGHDGAHDDMLADLARPWFLDSDGSSWRAQLPDGRTAVIRRKLGPDGEASLLFVPTIYESASDFVTGPECIGVPAAAEWAAGQVGPLPV